MIKMISFIGIILCVLWDYIDRYKFKRDVVTSFKIYDDNFTNIDDRHRLLNLMIEETREYVRGLKRDVTARDVKIDTLMTRISELEDRLDRMEG